MALKLKVHWRKEPLQVDFHREIGKIREIGESEASCHPHVRIVGDDVLVENFFRVKNKVLDVSRYKIGERGHGERICIEPHPDISGIKLKQVLQGQIGSIVLLLESPHKSEYTTESNVYNINRPQAPANGSSRQKIDRYLGEVLSRIEEQQLIVPGFHVVISNPIQFQTSLHAIHRKSLKNNNYKWRSLRNHVWLTLWDEERIQQSFRARLNRYNPHLVINACTACLKSRVNEFFREERRERWPNMTLYNVGHPVSWTRCDRISLNRIDPPTN